AGLVALLAGEKVFDAPPRPETPPYVVILRHDLLSRDTDLAPGGDHRLLVVCWHPAPSRKAVLEIAERVVDVWLNAPMTMTGRVATHRQHDRTDTAIDLQSGQARASLVLRAFTEPTD